MGHLLSDIYVVGAAILRGDTCLVALRSESMREPGRWEFPGGKVEAGESAADALKREIDEELGCEIRPTELLGESRVATQNGSLRLEVYEAELISGVPHPGEHQEVRWAGAAELVTLSWAPADVPIVPAVIERLRRPQARERSISRPMAKPPTRLK